MRFKVYLKGCFAILVLVVIAGCSTAKESQGTKGLCSEVIVREK